MNNFLKLSFLSLLISLSSATVYSQINLLRNPSGSEAATYWKIYGNAKVETDDLGNGIFTVRDMGYFFQDIHLPENSAGKFALLISRCSSERLEPDGVITGLPYLYGYMLNKVSRNGGRIDEYLQGQSMRCRPEKINEWSTQWGVFKIPPTTIAIRFFLNQAKRRGVAQNGSAARFANMGLFLFDLEDEAIEFVRGYNAKYQHMDIFPTYDLTLSTTSQ